MTIAVDLGCKATKQTNKAAILTNPGMTHSVPTGYRMGHTWVNEDGGSESTEFKKEGPGVLDISP